MSLVVTYLHKNVQIVWVLVNLISIEFTYPKIQLRIHSPYGSIFFFKKRERIFEGITAMNFNFTLYYSKDFVKNALYKWEVGLV